MQKIYILVNIVKVSQRDVKYARSNTEICPKKRQN